MTFRRTFASTLPTFAFFLSTSFATIVQADDAPLRVGAAAVNLKSDKSMPIAGSIEARYTDEQEGELRAVAVVIEKPGAGARAPNANKLAIVACDVLWVPRDLNDEALKQIQAATGIPPECVLVNATHTHHAPSPAAAHDFGVSEKFREELQRAIIESVKQANDRLAGGECRFYFELGEEKTIGANSRLLLPDGNITWLNPLREAGDTVKPTGPFDPQLPVFDFRDAAGKSRALLFNHSTHTIGTKSGKNVRSPGFYGLAAQELEQELGGVVSFLEGASGSTHNITLVPVPEAIIRIKGAVQDARAKAQPQNVDRLASIRRPLKFRVRQFDDAEEDAKIARYTEKYAPQGSDLIRKVFSNMRQKLKDQQGQERETWVQAMLIGDVAIVGVPAEYFTALGVDIKRRSPFKNTYVAELANDWIGYLPDREGHRLGGYQTWMGLHSYAEVGTGERVADEAVAMLNELAGTDKAKPADAPKEEGKAAPKREAQTPADERQSFRLADPDLRIELVAAEPDVVSPVAIAWDADERLYVAQMIGYPTTETSGRISRLEDRDGDGRYEHADVFADGLNFPTSVMPFRDGILVTDAPDILFLKDTDGDGKADERWVEFTGFNPGSQQLRANALHWGPDNWIYGANGRCDGEIRRADNPSEPAVSIRARDFRFHPTTKEFQAISGQSQFGQAHDDWGDRFLSWNTIPVRHVAVADEWLASARELSSKTVVDITDPDDAGEVFPTSPPPQQFNSERANYYNAMCGLTILRGDVLGSQYRGNAFVGESLTNLVTRRVLEPSGPTFIARRGEEKQEFLTSTDSWFHPVFTATGPDGALYVVDFYRELVEHPIYVASTEIRAQVNWRHGFDHGRIWRISNREFRPEATHVIRRPSSASTLGLVQALNDSVGWRRDIAQRLLVERHDATAIEPLRNIVRTSPSEFARLHALWTLDGLGSLDDEDVKVAMADKHPRIREHGLRLAVGRLSKSPPLQELAAALVSDPDLRTRFALVQALGEIDSSKSHPLLCRLVRETKADSWFGSAVLAVAGQNVDAFVLKFAEDARSWFDDPDDAQSTFLLQCGMAVGTTAQPKAVGRFVRHALADYFRDDGSYGPGTVAMLAGISVSTNRKATGVRVFVPNNSPAEAVLSGRLDMVIEAARKLAVDSTFDIGTRTAIVEFLREGDLATVKETILQLFATPQPSQVLQAAARVLAGFDNVELSRKQYENWEQYGQSARRAITGAAVLSPGAGTALIEALEGGKVVVSEIPIEVEAPLKALKDPRLAARFAKIMGENASADRKAVVESYRGTLAMDGNVSRGANVFKQHCLNCHTIQRFGKQVGPDLTGVSSRPMETLLAEILDPSARVSNDFLAYTAVTEEGKSTTGILANENPDAIMLKTAEAETVTVARNNLAVLRASGKSLMPEGFEKKVDPQAMADLLAFLRQPRRELLGSATP